MKLIPQSLFGRLAVILFSGFLLAQLASIAIQFQDRGQRLFQASGLSSSERIADIVRLLDATNADERNRLISILNMPNLRISLSKPSWPNETNSMENLPASMFKKRLLKKLDKKYSVHVAVSDKPTVNYAQGMAKFNQHSMQHMQNMGAVLPDALVFFAQVKLTDGTWVTFENNISDELFTGSSTLLLTLAVLIISVLLLSLLAVRWVTKPLTILTDAASKLGTNINQPPLPETGPTELKHAASTFNLMQIRLQKFIKDRTSLLSAISHDLKTPITRMRLRAEMLDDSEQRVSFIKNLDEMQQIATETLDFLRADDASETLQTIDICALLEAIKEDTEELGQHVELDVCHLTPCNGRPLALKRCISNLIENANKYAKNTRVITKETDKTLTITISDSGTGIPEEKLETVFEPFYRLESSRNRDTGGTGLGLSIARNIALSHGGNLQLVNNPEGGLSAILTLPRNNA